MATSAAAPPQLEVGRATTPDTVPEDYGLYITRLDPTADMGHWPRYLELGEMLGATCPCGCGVFMPHQRDLLQLAAARLPDTEVPRYPDLMATQPRQTGKTIVAATFLAHKGTDPELATGHVPQLVYTAQTRKDAAKRLGLFAVMYERAQLPIKYTQGVGNERIRFLETGATLEIVPPTDLGGHGESLDALVADECWALSPVFMGGIQPARLARPRSQALYISTAGTVDSEVYLSLQRSGRDSLVIPDARLAYMEYAAASGLDVHDPDNWAQWIPALGHTISLESLARLVESPDMTPTEVERSVGNRTVLTAQPVVPVSWWDETQDATAMPEGRRIVLSVELGRGPSSVAIVAAWGDRGELPHVELLDYQPTNATGWVGQRMDDLVRRHQVVAIAMDKGGPAGAVHQDVLTLTERRGIKLRNVWPREMGAACGGFYQRLKDRGLTHGAAQELDDAVRGARRKYISDTWVWDRKGSVFDVTPLNAATMALFALQEWQDRPRPGVH